MEKLIRETTAYKILSADAESGRLSHTYLLHFADPLCLRDALKLFARLFFPPEPDVLRRVDNESFADFRLYPASDGKITVDGVSEIIEDCALRPVEGNIKLYVIDGIDTAGAIVQNKLLKTLEEPPEGVHFLLGAASLAPVLDTVVSRSKTLEIPPFSEEQIFGALERRGQNPANRAAAESANGVLGSAYALVSGEWFGEVRRAAEEICNATLADIATLSKKYGGTKYKRELLSEMRGIYFSRLTADFSDELSKHTLIYALEELAHAEADLKFNAFFQGLLYDFMLKVVKENEKWQKLRE